VAIKMPSSEDMKKAKIKLQEQNSLSEIDKFEKLIAANPGVAQYHYDIAQAYLGVNRIDDARKSLEKAVALDETFAHAFANLGMICHQQKDFKASYEYNKKAVQITPGFIPAMVNEGLALIGMEEYKKAIESLEKVLKIEPKMPMALAGIYQSYKLLGHKASAAKYLRLAEQAGVRFAE
jgi:tetratricopeptide (TPR) repeat protein